MASETQTTNLSPPPTGIPLTSELPGGPGDMITQTWTKWFVDLREKVNVINEALVGWSAEAPVTGLAGNYGSSNKTVSITINEAGQIASITEQDIDLAFNDLSDTPNSYAGQGGNYLQVKTTEDGIQFVSGGTSGYTPPVTTKGDIFVYSDTPTRLPVGTDGQQLTADSSEPTGLRYADPLSGFLNVPTYNNLPSNFGSSDAGKAYYVVSDSMVYVWNGSAWPAQGEGSDISGGSGKGSHTELMAYIQSLSPVVYIPMDPSNITGGTTFLDQSGNGYDCTSGSAPSIFSQLIPGDSTTFPFFSGNSLGRTSAFGFPHPVNYSVSAIIIVMSQNTAYGWNSGHSLIFGINGVSGESPDTNFQCQFPASTSGNQAGVAFWEYNSGSDEVIGTNPGNIGVSITEPCMLACVKDSTAKRVDMYKNGVLIAGAGGNYSHEPTGNPPPSLSIGKNAVQTMGHFSLFNRVLTESEIVGAAKKAGFYPS